MGFIMLARRSSLRRRFNLTKLCLCLCLCLSLIQFSSLVLLGFLNPSPISTPVANQMLIHLISRLASPSLRSQPSKISALQFSTTVSAAERLYSHLQGCTTNLEKELASAKVKLDSSCINEVIKRCHPNQFQLGLRFFIWAGTQSDQRHSSYMYSKACDFLEIRTNPDLIKDVVEAYRKDKSFVSVKTMRIVLTLCNEAKLADEALWVLRKFSEFDLCVDTVSYNLVIRLFADKGDLNMADMLMKEMDCIDLYPDMITYTSMINGYCNAGKIDEAWRLVKSMSKHGCVVNTVTYSRIVEGVCKFGDMETVLELLGEMEKGDGDGVISPNTVTYTLVIQAFCEKKQIKEALLVLDRMGDRGCLPNHVTASVLIQGVLENDEDAKDLSMLIDKLVKLGGVSLSECFSSATVSLIRMKRWEEAEKIFRMMLVREIRPDGLACSLVFRELCLLERYLDCFLLYQEIEKAGLKSTIDSEIHAVLLLGLCQHGCSWEAAKLAKSMLDKKMGLKISHVEKIIEALKKIGDEDLMRRFSTD